jgi:arginase
MTDTPMAAGAPQPLAVIGVPSSAAAYAPGQEKAPAALRAAGLLESFARAGLDVDDRGDLERWRWHPDRGEPRAQNAPVVAHYISLTAERVRAAAADHVVLVLGGDCTVGIGTVAGQVATGERVGLIYFDMHADLNVPTSVSDGALDWMGLAHMLGVEGSLEGVTRSAVRSPLIAPDQVLLFAWDRDHATDWELQMIDKLSLNRVEVTEVEADPAAAAGRALQMMEESCERLVVHFDVDTIDFVDAPLSENTGRNTGLSLETAMRALAGLLATPRFAALTVTELNPDHGEEDGSTVGRFAGFLVDALAPSPGLAKRV